MMTPEQNRDRILARIDAIMNQPYKAPERIKSELYAFMIEEFRACSEATLRAVRDGKVKP